MKLPPVGMDSLLDFQKGNLYYVDKTPFIKTVVQYNAKVLLITRPRRFGKSLFMDTIFRFLAINPAKPGNTEVNAKLFSGLKISEDHDFCDAYMGQYPVVSLSLKSIEGLNFTRAYRKFASCILESAKLFSFLLASPRLSQKDKEKLIKYQSDEFLKNPENQDYAEDYLKDIVAYLGKHFERKVIVLIDEYDVPISKAAKNGYYQDMIMLIRSFLSEALKPNSANAPYLEKAILTGCLRVSKESVFTGLNNPAVNTVCSSDPTLTEAIGFTRQEVDAMLRYYGLHSRADEIRRWYDGYLFGQSEMYCPWDLLNFCSDAIRGTNPLTYQPQNYWTNTSGNDVVDEFLGFLSGEETEKMQKLVDGGEIEVTINETLNYVDLKNHNPQDFWTLLLFTGYLTIAKRPTQSAKSFALRIPNEEIRDTFIKRVQERFSANNKNFLNDSQQLALAFVSGDVDAVRMKLKFLLQRFVSIRDRATRAKAENFYHGFLLGIFTALEESISAFRSNAEAGNGYADILFASADEKVGVIVEVKVSDKREGSMAKAQKALEQITDKEYGQYFQDLPCKKIYAYGLVFFGKDCNVLVKTLEK